MALDRIVTIRPFAANEDDDTQVSAWAEVRSGDGLAFAAKQVNLHDQFYQGAVPSDDGYVAPRSTQTLRIRWRSGLSLRSRFIDSDEVIWSVNGIEEVGRKQWLDVSLSSWDVVQTGGVTPGSFTPPVGWHLQSVAGVPVAELTGLVVKRDERALAIGLQATVPEGGWRIAPGMRMDMLDITFPIEVAGVDATMSFEQIENLSMLDLEEDLSAGDLWPARGLIILSDYASADYEALAHGVISIRSA